MVTDFTIELRHGKPWLCENGVYERSSVLAGQEFSQLIRPYDSVEEAEREAPKMVEELGYPGFKVTTHLDAYHPPAFIPLNPPSDFDPLDAGEAWGEEDY